MATIRVRSPDQTRPPRGLGETRHLGAYDTETLARELEALRGQE